MQPRHYFAIGVFAGTTLLGQIALTRLFSVVQYYHGAFLAISLALFGFSVSGVWVFLRSGEFGRERLDEQLGRYGLLFAASIPLSFYFYLYLGAGPALEMIGLGGLSLLAVALDYVLLALPFFASGVCIALLLSHGSAQANRLYAVDLISSAVGAVAVIPLLAIVGGPKSVLVASALAAVGALPFLKAKRVTALAIAGLVLAVAFVPPPWLNQLRMRKQLLVVATEPIFWNAFSMVGVAPEVQMPGWTRRNIIIDNSVSAEMVGLEVDPKDSEFLRSDWNATVHQLRSNANVLIIGAGGGRDILVARAYGQKHIRAVEVNPLVMRMANETFGEFTGHVYSGPDVQAVVGDARSYIANSSERFDIIMASLIDTWAASAAGAFALTENLLYTKDAFVDYFDHLEEDGILSISRWHPLETPRLLTTGLTAWKEAGVEDPRRHAILLLTKSKPALVVLLLKKSPFTQQEIAVVEKSCADFDRVCALTPDRVEGLLVSWTLARWNGQPVEEVWPGVDIEAVPDDRPFFFNMVRPSTQVARMLGLSDTARGLPYFAANLPATRMLVQLFAAVLLLLGATIAWPLYLRADAIRGRQAASVLGYFTCLGLGFILIEIGLVQRLILLLGKPVYSLSVILSSMLLASGLGSATASRFALPRLHRVLPIVLAVTSAILWVQAFALPGWIQSLLGTPFPVRVTMSLVFVSVPAFLMGMAFPSAIRALESQGRGDLVPWVWGVNGATSVLASVGAIILAIQLGYTAVFILGASCYLLAAPLFAVWSAPSRGGSAPGP